MASDDLAFATIAEIAARYRRGALSPVELTRALLGRIERFDPTLHAFVTVTAERALADARRAEAALRRDKDGNPLLGIPVAYKDIYATRGIRTTAGSAVLADWVPEDDATCVTRLQRAGCVMLGKLITHEFAFGLQFPGHRFQPARNPWSLEHMPGGSSSGSAAALAAGYLVPLGQGIRGLRVGVPRASFFEGVDAEVEKAFEEALATLRDLGATVTDVEIPSIQTSCAFLAILMAEAFAYHERDVRGHPELYGDVVRERLLAGGLILGSEYVQAQRLRSRLQAEMLGVLRRTDVLVTPTTPKPAPTFAAVWDPSFGFPKSNMAPFNMTGLPALAVPCGFSAQGLPLSLQIAGRPFDESTVLRLGHAYEQATEWHGRRPRI